MRIISFNINGIRAINKKPNTITSVISNLDPDIICFQEIRCSQEHISEFDKYKSSYPYIYLCCSVIKKGYSGVSIMSKIQPLTINYNFDIIREGSKNFEKEGRVII